MSTTKSLAKTGGNHGPWLEYVVAAVLYSLAAVALHLNHRPILFWLCVVFAIGAAAGCYVLVRPSGRA